MPNMGVGVDVVWLGSRWPNSIGVAIDMSGPLLNRAVHGFLKVGAVAACKVAAEDAFEWLSSGADSKHKHALKRMCNEGAYWGAVAGVYEATAHGVEQIRGRSDWKNALIGGALTGALISAATATAGSSNDKQRGKVIKDAIAGGAVATAVEFINRRSRVDLVPITSGDANEIATTWERQDATDAGRGTRQASKDSDPVAFEWDRPARPVLGKGVLPSSSEEEKGGEGKRGEEDS
ncbi:outer envelope pore protein 16, chloroplastic-like [Phragmites australis]|uniref:outer envelope pore protein 16, chloroplastic-like n=1 Tax=Phragmites australis TaxID=29695 RepID=UPI002D785E72|nr:outer envelope pore protein 16, chloroplastic-like [Phragmites australis]